MIGPAWDRLERELNCWSADNPARLWWRDDDAVQSTDALDRLLAMAGARPLALAVIPSALHLGLVETLDPHSAVNVLVHGWAHRNHEGPAVKKAEFGSARHFDEAVAEAKTGLETLQDATPDKTLPIFVPPWNRIAPELAGGLLDSGYQAISTFNDRPKPVGWINTHVDVLDWRQKKRSGTATFVGLTAAVEALVGALARHRLAQDGEPIGLLTHHLEHDCATWTFLDALIRFWDAHPHTRWMSVKEAMPA